jgi:hypothetical protein
MEFSKYVPVRAEVAAKLMSEYQQKNQDASKKIKKKN